MSNIFVIEARASHGRHVPGGGVIARGSALRHFSPTAFRVVGRICMKNLSIRPAMSAAARIRPAIGATENVKPAMSGTATVRAAMRATTLVKPSMSGKLHIPDCDD